MRKNSKENKENAIEKTCDKLTSKIKSLENYLLTGKKTYLKDNSKDY